MRLTFTGLGPLRIGMSEAEIRAAVAGKLDIVDIGEPDECYDLQPVASGIGLMMLKRRLARIDVYEGDWRTEAGVGVGSSEGDVRRSYGAALRVERHHYDAAGKYLIVRSSRYKQYEIRFETDGTRVTQFRAGTIEAVILVEGCA